VKAKVVSACGKKRGWIKRISAKRFEQKAQLGAGRKKLEAKSRSSGTALQLQRSDPARQSLDEPVLYPTAALSETRAPEQNLM
jgi:hypothetical protein